MIIIIIMIIISYESGLHPIAPTFRLLSTITLVSYHYLVVLITQHVHRTSDVLGYHHGRHRRAPVRPAACAQFAVASHPMQWQLTARPAGAGAKRAPLGPPPLAPSTPSVLECAGGEGRARARLAGGVSGGLVAC